MYRSGQLTIHQADLSPSQDFTETEFTLEYILLSKESWVSLYINLLFDKVGPHATNLWLFLKGTAETFWGETTRHWERKWVNWRTNHRDLCVENKFWSNIWNTWKYWWNETDDEILPVFYLTIPLNFEIYLLKFPWESVLVLFSDNCLYL